MNEQEKIISEAAAWVVRVDAGIDGAGQDAFLDWLTADRRHGAEYERQCAHWARLDILADWRPEHAEHPNRDLLAPAAGAAARGCGSAGVPPGIFFRVREHWWHVFLTPAKFHWRALAGGALGAAAAACVALLMSVAPNPKPIPNPKPNPIPFASSVAAPAPQARAGAISTIEQSKLDDGTIVELNRGASITVSYTPAERLVKLDRGEVNFLVAKDPARPFIVDIDGVRVRAVGTSFNIRRGSGAVEVLVTSGSVQVRAAGAEAASPLANPPAENTVVKARQMAVVTTDARMHSLNIHQLASNQIQNITAWHPRLLDIEKQPLSRVVDEFNKCNAPIRLVIADPELAKTEVSATLRSDQVENLVRLLEGGVNGLHVKVERAGDVVTLRRILGI